MRKGKNDTTDLSSTHHGAHVVLGKDALQRDHIRLIGIKNSFHLKGQGPDTSSRIVPGGSCVDIHMEQRHSAARAVGDNSHAQTR
jgi:hypothetical protein